MRGKKRARKIVARVMRTSGAAQVRKNVRRRPAFGESAKTAASEATRPQNEGTWALLSCEVVCVKRPLQYPDLRIIAIMFGAFPLSQ
jgi:hypothetical protein